MCEFAGIFPHSSRTEANIGGLKHKLIYIEVDTIEPEECY